MRYDPRHLFRELRRRHVVRMTAAYLIASFALLEAADVLQEPLDMPTTVLTVLFWILALGLAPVIVLTWIYDLTPEGLRRTVGWHDDDAGHTTTLTSSSAEAPAVRLLVLPFRILRPDAETDYIAFALPDAIACALMGLRSLTVRSSLAAAQVAREQDLASVAATADVDAILSGTVVRAGAALRISAQLASAADGALLWAQTELVQVESLFEHQDALARRIVHSLAVPLSPAETRQLGHDVPATPRAYELYLKANQLGIRAADWAAARDVYLDCLVEDPRYAPAWARLGRCWRLIGNWAGDLATQRHAFAEAERAFRRALELNPQLALATSLYAQFEIATGRPEAALTRLLDRMTHHITDAATAAALVYACRCCGLLEQSIAADEVARGLDPGVQTSVAHTWFMLGDYDRTVSTTDASDIGYLRAVALAALGHDTEAVDWLLAQPTIDDDEGSGLYLRSLLTLLQDRRDEAVALTMRVLSTLTDGEARFYMARQLARAGAHSAAIQELKRVVDSGFTPVRAFAEDPWLESVREDAAFNDVLDGARQRQHAASQLLRAHGGSVSLHARVLTS